MIQGEFGSKGEPFFEIELIGADGFICPVDALFDTGFTGFLAINKQDIEGLNWTLIDKETLRTAQGETAFDIYLGRIILDGQEFEIPIFAGGNIQEILLGSEWLRIFDLIAKYKEGVLSLVRSPL
ncbi:MAG: aspartyl protease [Xenococcaceae cyanobacterium]